MPRKIVFVEDDKALHQTVGEALKEEGFEFISVFDGDSATEVIKKELPDLVILDLVLPGKDGFEILREIRKYPATKSLPVIVLTNLDNFESIQQALELGSTMYLVKMNYSMQDLIQKIKEALEG